ncbi:hypothetical protein F5148DRAFT_1172145 [Russula earlei]|uniref:Uncharacterized protein n=1 Tax=Russula earlei TaxID=71964 RepID=A0ACC0UI73_9AGAM|nr:hypothetical protein F5148DRAFT_1172145 [Russula earlei]
MRISVFVIFCLAVGIAPSLALPSGQGDPGPNSLGLETSPTSPSDSTTIEQQRALLLKKDKNNLKMMRRRRKSLNPDANRVPRWGESY